MIAFFVTYGFAGTSLDSFYENFWRSNIKQGIIEPDCLVSDLCFAP